MANPEHVKILKQGVEVWNKWREDNFDTQPNFQDANLSNTILCQANLSRSNLIRANISDSDLITTSFDASDLREANLSESILQQASFIHANLSKSDLSWSNLKYANLTEANLENTNLSKTYLGQSIFLRANLDSTKFEGALISETIFSDIDLTKTIGLEKLNSTGPSTVDHLTLMQSKNLPAKFLRDCGFPDQFIEHLPSLLNSLEPIQFYSCFISYSSKDEKFAQRLYADLQARGIRCWYAPEDMKIGDKIRPRIDEVIHLHEKLLLVLSENSIDSGWVEKEVETAFEKENDRKKTVLFPIRLDDAVMDIKTGWPADIKRTRHIGDFRNWKDHDAYQKNF